MTLWLLLSFLSLLRYGGFLPRLLLLDLHQMMVCCSTYGVAPPINSTGSGVQACRPLHWLFWAVLQGVPLQGLCYKRLGGDRRLGLFPLSFVII